METYKGRYTGAQIDALLGQVAEMAPAAAKDYELYAFKKCIFDSGPFSRIIYDEDNKNYTPASMDFRTGKFNYGDWENAFFMKVKPVMLGYDGKIKEELNPDNYARKKSGAASSNTSTSFEGNCMVGIPTVWVKRKQIGIWQYTWICSKKLDDDFHAWAHTNADGDIIPYFYYPAYNGTVINGVMRSISGQVPTVNTTATQEINYALANNSSGKNMWYTNVIADRMLINDLLTLIGKSSDKKSVFGYGHYTDGSKASDLKPSGILDNKGLFWGSNNSGYCVKIFGIENYYGNRWDRIGGWIYNSSAGQLVKLTYGREDGSTTIGYNMDGTGYILLGNSVISGTNGGYIKETFADDYGVWPFKINSSEGLYEAEGCWFANGANFAVVGSDCYSGLLVGPGCASLSIAASFAGWGIGGSCSCKPELET